MSLLRTELADLRDPAGQNRSQLQQYAAASRIQMILLTLAESPQRLAAAARMPCSVPGEQETWHTKHERASEYDIASLLMASFTVL